MGRTLDTLRQPDLQRPVRSAMPAMPAGEAPPAECVVDWSLQEQVPYIEVGGPGKGVELSPLLVAHPAQAKVQPPHPHLGKALASAKAPEAVAAAAKPAPAVNLTDAQPMTVAFEAWPGPHSAGGIAPDVIAYHQPEHPVSKEYAVLLDRMMQGLGSGPRVLMFNGLARRVGTTTVLLNLAAVAARHGQR